VSRAGVVSILLSAWLGAAVLVTTVVAPAAFAVLPSRTLAGALVGRVLPVLFIAGLVVALASLSLDSGEALMLLVTGLLFFVARLLAEAQRLADEHSQIV